MTSPPAAEIDAIPVAAADSVGGSRPPPARTRIEHGNPGGAILQHLGGKGVLDHLAGHHHIKHNAAGLHVILHGFPGQFEATLEALNHPFFFQLIESLRAMGHRFPQQP